MTRRPSTAEVSSIAKVIADISVSLDGFTTGAAPGREHGLGIGGEPLREWARTPSRTDRRILDEAAETTGAVLMGRRTYEFVDGPNGWAGDLGYGGERDQSAAPPVFVLSSSEPGQLRQVGRFHFVRDGLPHALSLARSAAGDKDVVLMGGADLIRRALDTDQLDELHLHLAPVLLGAGTRLFGAPWPRRLQQLRVRQSEQATHLDYGVLPSG